MKVKKIGEVFENLSPFFGCPYRFNSMKIHLGTALTIEEVTEHMTNLLTDFNIHNLTNIKQLHNFKQAKKNLKPNELIIREDSAKIVV